MAKSETERLKEIKKFEEECRARFGLKPETSTENEDNEATLSKNNYTYGFPPSSISRMSEEEKLSPELQKFEDEVRASLGLAPIKRIENNPEEKKPEVNPVSQQTKKALEARALIDNALQKAKSNQEVEMFEKEIRASFNLK